MPEPEVVEFEVETVTVDTPADSPAASEPAAPEPGQPSLCDVSERTVRSAVKLSFMGLAYVLRDEKALAKDYELDELVPELTRDVNESAALKRLFRVVGGARPGVRMLELMVAKRVWPHVTAAVERRVHREPQPEGGRIAVS